MVFFCPSWEVCCWLLFFHILEELKVINITQHNCFTLKYCSFIETRYILYFLGTINGNLVMWYFAIPLTYLEAGLCCSATQFMNSFTNCYVLCFTIFFMYILTPLSAKFVTFLLSYFNINIWLLKGMEVNPEKLSIIIFSQNLNIKIQTI